MRKTGLKHLLTTLTLEEILTTLTLEEKCCVILAYLEWFAQQARIDIAQGFVPVSDTIVDLTKVPPKTLAALDRAVATNDSEKILLATLTDMFRGLAIMQKQSTGPKLNQFFRAHIPAPLFAALYGAAKLDLATLRYNIDFPTGPIPLAP
jgi:hypothetical protein